MGRCPTVELYVVFQVVFIVHSSKESSERSEAVNDTKQVGAERCGERITERSDAAKEQLRSRSERSDAAKE